LNLTGISGVGHSETHAFYLGTINRAATNDGDGITINNNWYTSSGAPRATTGYDWSRIGAASPPADGISSLAGGSASRTHVAVTASTPWSNLGSLNLTGDSSGLISNTNALNLTYRYQDSAGAGAVTFYLDNDTNPYDGFSRTYGSTSALAGTGATPNVSGVQSFPITWTSAGLSTGLYRVAAKITNAAGLTRYAYMTRPVYVTATGAELINRRFSNDLANASWTSTSNFTPGGTPIANDHVLIPAGSVTIPADATNQSLILSVGSVVTSNTDQHLLSLTLASGATFDLKDNDLVVTNANFSAIQFLVFQGYSATPDSTKTGIISTTSQNSGGVTILSLFDNALLHSPSFPAAAIVGKYTYLGDTDWDGQVTPQDYTAVDANLGATNVPAGEAWFRGDTDFDGNITPQDYTAIDASLGLGIGNPLAVPSDFAPLSLKRELDSILA
jgi:hypothetical protein